jgi:hypothetical protein
MSIRLLRLFPLNALTFTMGCAELQGMDLSALLDRGMPLDQATVASGLKQALDVGTKRTTSMLSAPGGFATNPSLRIGLPGELGRLARGLRQVGLGGQVDQLEDSMNLAAEQAAAKAVPVFTSAIASMTIADAFEILNGPENAATVYFQERTSTALRKEFAPIAASAMQQVGLYETYQDVVAQYDAIPFSKPPAFNLEAYVTDQTLAALFGELAKEEALIRSDPAARSTALLRRVFGSVSTGSAGGGSTAP